MSITGIGKPESLRETETPVPFPTFPSHYQLDTVPAQGGSWAARQAFLSPWSGSLCLSCVPGPPEDQEALTPVTLGCGVCVGLSPQEALYVSTTLFSADRVRGWGCGESRAVGGY